MTGEFGIRGTEGVGALKTVLKWEIQHLLQRLADIGEEALVLTVSVKDGDTTELGSQKGQGFLSMSAMESVKLQFLTYCQGYNETYRSDVSSQCVNGAKSPEKSGNRRKRRKQMYLQKTKFQRIDNSEPEIATVELDLNYVKRMPPDCDIPTQAKCGGPLLSQSHSPPTIHSMKSRRKRTPHRMVSNLLPSDSSEEGSMVSDLEIVNQSKEETDSEQFGQTGPKSNTFSVQKSHVLEKLSENQLKIQEIISLNQTDWIKQEVVSSNQSDWIKQEVVSPTQSDWINQTGSRLDRFLVSKSQSMEQIRENQFINEDHTSHSEDLSLDLAEMPDICKSEVLQEPHKEDLLLSAIHRYPKESYFMKFWKQESKKMKKRKTKSEAGFGEGTSEFEIKEESSLYSDTSSPVFPSMHEDIEDGDNLLKGKSGKTKSASKSSRAKEIKFSKHRRSLIEGITSAKNEIGESLMNTPSRKKYFKPISLDENPAETALLDASKLGVGRYQCPMCLQTTRDRHDLKRHLRTHAKDKPFKCKLCGKDFTRKWDLENHMSKYHKGDTENHLDSSSTMSPVQKPVVNKRNSKSKTEPSYELSYENLIITLLAEKKNIKIPVLKSEFYSSLETGQSNTSCSNVSVECDNIKSENILPDNVNSKGDNFAEIDNGSQKETPNQVSPIRSDSQYGDEQSFSTDDKS